MAAWTHIQYEVDAQTPVSRFSIFEPETSFGSLIETPAFKFGVEKFGTEVAMVWRRDDELFEISFFD